MLWVVSRYLNDYTVAVQMKERGFWVIGLYLNSAASASSKLIPVWEFHFQI